jgi:C4-dicarboxylate transporter DctM subunit
VIFSRILTVQRIPQELLQVFLALTQNKVLLVMLVIVLFLIVGMFMDAAVNMVILGPLLMPTLVQGAGMHPIQFGMFLMVGLLIGLLTPPVGCVFSSPRRSPAFRSARCRLRACRSSRSRPPCCC